MIPILEKSKYTFDIQRKTLQREQYFEYSRIVPKMVTYNLHFVGCKFIIYIEYTRLF